MMNVGSSKFTRSELNTHSHKWLEHHPCNTNVKVMVWYKQKKRHKSPHNPAQCALSKTHVTSATSWLPSSPRSQKHKPELQVDKNVCVSGNSREYTTALNSLAQADTLQMQLIHQEVKKALKLHIFRRMEAKVAHFSHLAQHRTCYHIICRIILINDAKQYHHHHHHHPAEAELSNTQ